MVEIFFLQIFRLENLSNKRLKKSIFGRKMIVFDWKFWKNAIRENSSHKNTQNYAYFSGQKFWLENLTENFGTKNASFYLGMEFT